MRNDRPLYDTMERLLREDLERADERLRTDFSDHAARIADFQYSLKRFNGFVLYGIVPEDIRRDASELVAGRELAKAVVMVVDDENAVLRFVTQALSRAGYRVLAASYGEEALGMARAWDGRIDLVLTDIRMPGMDGPELVRQLREEKLIDKVLLMTGYSYPPVPAEIVQVALRKPFAPEFLLEKIELALAA